MTDCGACAKSNSGESKKSTPLILSGTGNFHTPYSLWHQVIFRTLKFFAKNFAPLKFFAKNFAPLKKHSNRVSGHKKDRPLMELIVKNACTDQAFSNFSIQLLLSVMLQANMFEVFIRKYSNIKVILHIF